MEAAEQGPGTWRDLLRYLREDRVANGRSWSRPGFHAVAAHRFEIWRRGLPRLVRVPLRPLSFLGHLIARNLYGIEIDPNALIGRRLFIAHQGGIVVGMGVVVGDDCVIRQNATIGAVNQERLERPSLGDRVEVGVGAVLIGRISVGDGARIGPNAVVMSDVPPGASVFTPPAKVLPSLTRDADPATPRSVVA